MKAILHLVFFIFGSRGVQNDIRLIGLQLSLRSASNMCLIEDIKPKQDLQ